MPFPVSQWAEKWGFQGGGTMPMPVPMPADMPFIFSQLWSPPPISDLKATIISNKVNRSVDILRAVPPPSPTPFGEEMAAFLEEFLAEL
jgi:hypothetical protein